MPHQMTELGKKNHLYFNLGHSETTAILRCYRMGDWGRCGRLCMWYLFYLRAIHTSF